MESSYPKVLIVGPKTQNSHVESQRLFVDVVIIDKANQKSLHPVVYQLKQNVIEVLEIESAQIDHLLRGDDDPFMVVGEVVEIDRQKKILKLSNENTIAYKHLIVVSGSSNSQHIDEYSNALQALIEALKIRKHLSQHLKVDNDHCKQSSFKHIVAPGSTMDAPSIDIEQITRETVETGSGIPSHSRSLFEVQV